MSKKLLLIGGGMAHLSLLKRLMKENPLECEITLLNSNSKIYHSPMFPEFVEGIYQLDDLEIDLPSLSERAGIRFVEGTALSIDVKQKMVLTEKGDILSFDLMSLDIGSRRKGIELLPDQTNIIKPDRQDQIRHYQDDENKKRTVVIVGDGSEAIGMSFALKAWKRKQNDQGEVLLISTQNEYEFDAQSRQKLFELARNAGISVSEDEKVIGVGLDKITTAKGTIPYDSLLWINGSEAPKIYKSSKLPTDGEGYLLVEDTLQVKQYPFIFGAGSGVTISNYPAIPRNEVVAVRQGEILFDNLKGYLQSGDGYHFQLPKRRFSIVSTGNRRAFLNYGSFKTSGKLAWKLKDKINRRFIAQFR